MYAIDTLQRLNDQAVHKYYDSIATQVAKMENDVDLEEAENTEIITCGYCDQPATEAIPVFNPADALREVDGAYDLVHICDDCRDNGYLEENRFWCPGCGDLFITKHSWDSLGCIVNDQEYCQVCAIETIQPVTLLQVISDIENHATDRWLRLIDVPGKDKIWEGEFSSYSDFPGHTDTGYMAAGLIAQTQGMGYHMGSYVYPVITHTYQFSVALGVYAD